MTDNSASLEKPDWNCECGFSRNSFFSIRCLKCEKYRPAPSSSPRQQPTTVSEFMAKHLGWDVSKGFSTEQVRIVAAANLWGKIPAESSPKPAESPELPRCIHGNHLRDWAGEWLRPECGCEFPRNWEHNPNLRATPSPEPPRQTAQSHPDKTGE